MAKTRTPRKTQLGRREAIREQLRKVFSAVEAGYAGQTDRADDTDDFWEIYNCRLTSRQFYNGNSKLYIPLVHNAIEARKTRYLNQLFPQAGRYIEVTTEDGEIPHAEMALIELYVERARLKTHVAPALLVAGDIEGQYTVMASWESRTRHVVSRETRPLEIGGIEHPDLDPVETLVHEAVEVAGPAVRIVPDSDLLILPQTAETVEEALAAGGSVTTICRWSEKRIEELIEDGEIDDRLAAELVVEMGRGASGGTAHDTAKTLAEAAGIKAQGKHCLVYRTWTYLKVDGERRLVLAYWAGEAYEVLGCKLCPYWNDKPDIITRPVKKMPGVAKGMSLVKPCADMQYMANDFANLGADSGVYSMLPVIMTDPEKNPRYSSMVMDLMAVWEVSPQSTQPLAMPQLYQHAFNIIQSAERYINATLGVNAAMLPQSTGVPGRKRNQAEIAMEQQIDLLSTAVEVGAIEGLLSEVVERFAEYDAQFRDDEIMVRSVGELGVKAQMQTVKPLQAGNRWRYRWFGVEAARTAQQAQQQIAALNVFQQWAQHPAVAEAGYSLNPVPVLRATAETVWGPRMAPEVFKNRQEELSVPPELENRMLAEGLFVPVAVSDMDPKHIEAHAQAEQQTEDVTAKERFRLHIMAHQKQMQMKQAAQAMQQMARQVQGGGQPGRGPAPGGQPTAGRPMRSPNGALHQDRMPAAGATPMPRKT